MNSKDRILKFLEYLGIGQNAFEKKVGIANGYINNNKGSFGSKIIARISIAYPDLNTVWLLTGEGEMLRHNFFVNNGQHGNIIAGSNIRTSNSNNRNIEDKKQKECLLCKEKDQLIRSLELQLQVRQEQLQDKNEQLQAKDKIINSLIDKIK